MRRALLMCLGLVLLIGLPVQAEVFQLKKGQLLERLGWARAYSTTVEINGEKAAVDVWNSPHGFFKSLNDIRDLCTRRGFPESIEAGESIGFGIAVDGDTLHRWLVTRIDDDDRNTVVYQTTIPLAAFKRGGKTDTIKGHRLRAIPHFDASEATSHYVDSGTKMEVEVSRTAENGLLLQTWFDRQMAADGWGKPLPANPDGTRVYQRGRERAMVTLRDAKEGGTLITRVYKQAGKR